MIKESATCERYCACAKRTPPFNSTRLLMSMSGFGAAPWVRCTMENAFTDQQLGVATAIGDLTVSAVDGAITCVEWRKGPGIRADTPPVLRQAALQLRAYFNGARERFSLPLELGPGAFQARFQQTLLDVPFGQTVTYGELGTALGVSARAIGQACGANRLPVIVPCHRVVAAANLGGYSGKHGVETKVALLRHEGAAGLLI